ncbi:MAG: phosphoglucosamine mutase [Candidatus Fluviicola riflensis]|nr:MAG: phosphoglucosamine mutase [Candidatus Fluviicola riflensis]OGS79219.1 MAG: phosphoglucosamine mutase [Candidatus Fluviicola riflensis]OGS86651.1 MAG: phosphoglucosamine mutase [Fluviicola sp. RIFCSPHIGHO2_01_FULL_43_53]OGS88875.1 MAG: phosphoglucosamine mutase [Fluviicola sp. RIFCSPHIGHO2_12_FULL_43_24]
MTLIKSISGIRGTIGGKPGDALTPIDAVQFAAAYGSWLKLRFPNQRLKVVVGRDARISGEMISQLVTNTLIGLGIDVVQLGLSTTPTVEMAVPYHKANGGIILTASHNPKQWNALKLLNEKGEFISGAEGEHLLAIATSGDFDFAEVDDLGLLTNDTTAIDRHIDTILALDDVNIPAITAAGFSIVVDAVNSTGGIAVPALLRKLGVTQITELYCEPTGHFPHNPEPLPEHLTELSQKIKEVGADLGITVDPDVDRLALVNEDGSMFGEEYTLVAVSEYILSRRKGATVSNLSSTRALRDITEENGCEYHASAVGEVNVVEKMKAVNAVIGGEGNGGIIYPDLHYGRDSLVGIALFLTHLAQKKMSMTALRASYPNYEMAKKKIELTPGIDVDGILQTMAKRYENEEVDTTDGVKIYIGKEWVHLRKSNTEPIIRVYTESKDAQAASDLADKIINEIKSL